MADDEFNKNHSNLKVPPLKIVLSSHQSNAVVNIKDTETKASDVVTNNASASQRITRSSQRAQQNKVEPPNEANGGGDDSASDSARKAKKKKIEQQERPASSDGNDVNAPQITMAEICPADYQLPAQNSFELYRDIMKRPHKKMMKLNYIQPKAPHGFKDYRINSGPYLLDGNKLGVGLSGSKFPLRMKLRNIQKLSYYQPSAEVPKSIQIGSPLYELFQDQEKERHQMRIQHLKERERSILAAEQEMLRVYNKAAIADVKQKLHLSACTYLYYQEKYHYLDEKTAPKEVPHSQDNSFLCIEGDRKEERSCSENGDADSDASTLELNRNVVPEEMSDKDTFLNQLQEIDDKWAKIKKDMLVRHKNEADGLYAVQTLEWEWKVKEIGACDVRVSLKIEPEFVPKVKVTAIDY